MNQEITTAEEFLKNYRFKAREHIGNNDLDTIAKYAKDFTKIHVEACKDAIRDQIWGELREDSEVVIDDCYPEGRIK